MGFVTLEDLQGAVELVVFARVWEEVNRWVQPGDIVVEFDGKKVESPADLQRAVALTSAGSDAKLVVWRDQAEKTVAVKIGEAPDDQQRHGRSGGGQRVACCKWE